MLPLLRELADGSDHRIRELIPILADSFSLTDRERAQLLPSGQQAIFDNRVNWARTYLGKAGLLTTVGRGIVRVTDEGKQVLNDPPGQIDANYLMRFPEFRAFRQLRQIAEPTEAAPSVSQQTPEEDMEALWESLRDQTAEELLAQVKSASPAFFEHIVLDVLVAMGYGGSRADAAKTVGRSGDGGIDGSINEDKLGLDTVHVQAKKWESPVGRPVVQAFAGSLEGFRARKGVFITTSSFSRDAHDYVRQIEKKIVLIDGRRLVQLMLEHEVGVVTARSYDIKRVNSEYFESG